ncbi:hypothetical protein Enr17x_20140 [Gimesia fumaroli]|jgi:hypothetical protein|uniref:Uncharacterized protein n=1 Tax=Gimesia fumaroli TaxID=2527976 RepID=A0A518IA75_9PLAN|nr:hypothetical protein Enr17x_20140 [Gimesia fumaroli]
MFGILNETILAIYVLLTKWVRVLPTLLRSREPSQLTRAHILDAESLTQLAQKSEIVRRLLSYLGVELRLRVPVKVRSDRRCFKRR